MNYINQEIKTSLYGSTVAVSLILYAARNDEFAYFLKKILRQTDISGTAPETLNPEIFKNGKVVLPSTLDIAKRKTRWALENRETTLLLKKWADDIPKEDEKPKIIVVGIKVGRIPGLTFGRFKKRKSLMRIMVRKDVSADAVKAGISLFSKELIRANGRINKLEPEVADWYFEGKNLAFYRASSENMKKIINELKKTGVSHASTKNEKGITALAISPAVNENYIMSNWQIEKIY